MAAYSTSLTLIWYIVPAHFQTGTLSSIFSRLRPDLWTASIVLADAYLHVPVYPLDRHFLVFPFEDRAYLFQAMPFWSLDRPRFSHVSLGWWRLTFVDMAFGVLNLLVPLIILLVSP